METWQYILTAFFLFFFCSWISIIFAGSSSGAHRQAAVMALFLTGMINDGAHAANGPGETGFYQRHGGKEREERWGRGYTLCIGTRSLCLWARHRQCAPVSCFCKYGTALTRIPPTPTPSKRDSIWRTYLWKGVLKYRSWGPAPRQWLWAQRWPSVLR